MGIEIGKLTFHRHIGCVLFNPGLWLHWSISIDVARIHMCVEAIPIYVEELLLLLTCYVEGTS